MDKLNKRQVIILAVASLFALWAVYDLLIAGPAAKRLKMENKPARVENVVNTITNDIAQYRTVGINAYITANAAKDWGHNPFREHSYLSGFPGSEKGSVSAAKITYSGYVDTGRKRMAIINGWEYEAGEELDLEGYVLKSISPTRVLIRDRNTGGEIYIPLQE